MRAWPRKAVPAAAPAVRRRTLTRGSVRAVAPKTAAASSRRNLTTMPRTPSHETAPAETSAAAEIAAATIATAAGVN